jgi:hypothetical protein
MKKKIKKSGAGHGPVQPSKGSAPVDTYMVVHVRVKHYMTIQVKIAQLMNNQAFYPHDNKIKSKLITISLLAR